MSDRESEKQRERDGDDDHHDYDDEAVFQPSLNKNLCWSKK